jgi:hypothetical protein
MRCPVVTERPLAMSRSRISAPVSYRAESHHRDGDSTCNSGATICHAVGVRRARSRPLVMIENVVVVTLAIIRGCEVRERGRRRGCPP